MCAKNSTRQLSILFTAGIDQRLMLLDGLKRAVILFGIIRPQVAVRICMQLVDHGKRNIIVAGRIKRKMELEV